MKLTPQQREWLRARAGEAGRERGFRWWRVSLAVAAHESACGTSRLAEEHNNFHGHEYCPELHWHLAADDRYRRFPDWMGSWKSFEYLLDCSIHYAEVREMIRDSRSDDREALERAIVEMMGPVYCDPVDDPRWSEKVLKWLKEVRKCVG